MEYIDDYKGVTIKSSDGNITIDSCDSNDLLSIEIKNIDGDKAIIVVDKKMLITCINLFK